MALEIAVGVLLIAVFVLAYMVKRGGGRIALHHNHQHDVGQSLGAGIERMADGFAIHGEAIKENLHHVAEPIGDILRSIAEKIRGKHVEADKLKTESIALAQEVERLKNRSIQVDDVAVQLKLALIKSKHRYDSFHIEQIQAEAGGWFSRDTVHEYVGLVHADYSVSVGLDIEQLRFTIGENDQVYVSGLEQPEIIGIKDAEIKSLLGEVRESKAAGSVRDAVETILRGDPRCAEIRERHQATVLKEIQSKQSVEHFVDPVSKLAFAFLKTCLKPSGVNLISDEDHAKTGVGFFEMCTELNSRVNQSLVNKVAELQLIEQRQVGIQTEILALTGTT